MLLKTINFYSNIAERFSYDSNQISNANTTTSKYSSDLLYS